MPTILRTSKVHTAESRPYLAVDRALSAKISATGAEDYLYGYITMSISKVPVKIYRQLPFLVSARW